MDRRQDRLAGRNRQQCSGRDPMPIRRRFPAHPCDVEHPSPRYEHRIKREPLRKYGVHEDDIGTVEGKTQRHINPSESGKDHRQGEGRLKNGHDVLTDHDQRVVLREPQTEQRPLSQAVLNQVVLKRIAVEPLEAAMEPELAQDRRQVDEDEHPLDKSNRPAGHRSLRAEWLPASPVDSRIDRQCMTRRTKGHHNERDEEGRFGVVEITEGVCVRHQKDVAY